MREPVPGQTAPQQPVTPKKKSITDIKKQLESEKTDTPLDDPNGANIVKVDKNEKVKNLVKQAQMAMGAGRLGEAESMLKQALGVNPGYVVVHKQLGLLYQLKGNREAACQEFHTYVTRSPKASGMRHIEKVMKSLQCPE